MTFCFAQKLVLDFVIGKIWDRLVFGLVLLKLRRLVLDPNLSKEHVIGSK
jgi:hypothetical protein